MAVLAFGVCAVVSYGFVGQAPQFVESASNSGLVFTHQTDQPQMTEHERMPPGIAVADFDRDGWLDLFVAGGMGQNCIVYMNNGAGQFVDMTAQWQIELTDEDCAGVAAGDINNDGYPDLYVGTLWVLNRVYLNSGQGTFIDITDTSNAVLADGQPFSGFGAAFGDVDLDGDLDLVTADWWPHPTDGNRLFLNNGDSTFTDITRDAHLFRGLEGRIRGFAPALVDMDGDRYPEMIEAADFLTSAYYVNNRDLTFTQLLDNGTGTDENGMGSAIGDYDNDGDLDWFVTSIYDDDGKAEGNWGVTGNRMYRNEGNHQFTDVTDLAGVRIGWWGWGTSFADYNHDGLLDLAMTNGFVTAGGHNPDPTFENDPSVLWINTGDFDVGPTFLDVTKESGFLHTGQGRGLVTFDYDHDGDLDTLIHSNEEALTFFINQFDPPAERWLEVDLVPPPGNAPDGIGANLRLTVDGKTYLRTMIAGPSFMSSEPLRMHFGFPSVVDGLTLVVDWPDGTQTTRHNVTPGRILRFKIGDMDEDGDADTADWSQIAICLAGPAGGPAEGNCLNADFTADEVVDLIDVAFFQNVTTD